ncbi:hypothetical protein [Mucisphaera calidilacus]|uniref:Uncharacterized protein n=1 Tax=Mucisphaera calidilacus TaxID=2527982 RepID=A0A518BXG4_9BACT|nr:hypothetical protein [Mucisphaera calidilacus]QDU71672.1 hypothetical protein Pan265_15240 [Mucisphaera calidilacus]
MRESVDHLTIIVGRIVFHKLDFIDFNNTVAVTISPDRDIIDVDRATFSAKPIMPPRSVASVVV